MSICIIQIFMVFLKDVDIDVDKIERPCIENHRGTIRNLEIT